MSLALAAVAAVAAALLQSSVAPHIALGGAMPDLPLVVVLLWASFGGLEAALAKLDGLAAAMARGEYGALTKDRSA